MTARKMFKSVDEYIASQPLASREALERVRNAIVKALPHAKEAIAYNMPAYRLHDKIVLQFAAWSSHYALYASSGEIVRIFGDELRGYEVAKGTIRFPLGEPVPETLIARIAKYRADSLGR